MRIWLVAAIVCLSTNVASADISGPLANSIKTMSQTKSYHFSMTTPAFAVEGDFVNPGRYHTKVRNMDMIIIGPVTYMRMGSAPWKKLSSDTSPSAMDYMKTLQSTKNFTSTDLGMKSADGQLLHAYRVMGGKMHEPETVYLDGANHIARFDLGSGNVMRFTRFGEAISINAPI